jgi:RNA-directed DNA polymerase
LAQQAIAQVLKVIFDEGFFSSSYGFRPNKNAKQTIINAKGT